jgi:hypothetical protein
VSEEDWPSERPQRAGLISTKSAAFKALFPNGLDALRILERVQKAPEARRRNMTPIMVTRIMASLVAAWNS